MFIDLCEQDFGSLHVVCLSDKTTQSGERIWACECECGNITRARGNDLRSGVKTCCPDCARKRGTEARKITMAEKPKEPKPKAPKPVKPVYEPKEDCRAYMGDRCAGLKEMLCRTRGQCKFYKSKENTDAAHYD